MKKTNSKKVKKSKILKKPNSRKIIILENKKRFEEIKREEKRQKDLEEEDEDLEDFEFTESFRLSSSAKKNIETIPMGSSLESGLVFAPRIREKGKEGKNYSETKYEVKYDGGKYGEKTPNEYTDTKQSSGASEDSPNQ